MSYGVVQIRSNVDMSAEVEDTLDMLNLGTVNSFTVVPDTDSFEGMIVKVNDYVAYGEPDAATVAELIERRAETLEGDDVTDDYVAENTEYSSVETLAQALVDGETKLRGVGVNPKIRLHPPRKGHSGAKHAAREGGVLGNQGDGIDELLRRMR